jgi:hypothetical protein
MTAFERMERPVNPLDVLRKCPSCKTDIYDLAEWDDNPYVDAWTCPVCYAPWDQWWMFYELLWYDKGVEFDPYANPKNFDPDDFDMTTTLCCDMPLEVCDCDIKDYFSPVSIQNFLYRFNLSYGKDIYDTETYDNENCLACNLYATQRCIPLRNVLRFVNKYEIAPNTKLTPCYWFDPDLTFMDREQVDYSIIDEIIKKKAPAEGWSPPSATENNLKITYIVPGINSDKYEGYA